MALLNMIFLRLFLGIGPESITITTLSKNFDLRAIIVLQKNTILIHQKTLQQVKGCLSPVGF
ncbi:hypothetical protein Y919_12090 [Caloranaerobacter azorensis H53214]|uniref:Uncharacterized protein n=1 Tax=Caloranaerobacter azorensis H53214 TaxID=1156417 RepID=A0A096DJH0_9FIRM|nr:hypothetical protein Y919_12090 [Caloranaerobacter azorensis H53214]